jgi:hypothetical protein
MDCIFAFVTQRNNGSIRNAAMQDGRRLQCAAYTNAVKLRYGLLEGMV